jgi:hypothetical protein
VGKNEEYEMVGDIMQMVFKSADVSDEPDSLKFRDFYEQKQAGY